MESASPDNFIIIFSETFLSNYLLKSYVKILAKLSKFITNFDKKLDNL